MDDNGTSQKRGARPCAGFFLCLRAVLEVCVVTHIVGKIFAARQILVVYESRQDGAQDIVLEGIGTAAERIVHLAIMERCENRAVGG
jgi:hypothetical protein